MYKLKLKVIAVLLGVLITLLTGYASTLQLIGATNFGYPLTWLTQRVIAPIYNPWFINYFNFVVDILVWSFLAWVLLDVTQRHSPRSPAPKINAKKVRLKRRRR